MQKVYRKCIFICYNDLVKYKLEKKMARILISMPDEFLNKVDSVADGEQRSRSELIREALRSYIRRSRITNVEKAKSNAEILDKILD